MITLINDDCRNVIGKIRNDNSIIVTDPPFNIGYHYNSYKDKMNESEYFNMLAEICGGGAVCYNSLSRRNI